MLAESPGQSPPFRPPCPECYGRGMTAHKPVYLGGVRVGYRRDCCPVCGGTGRAPEAGHFADVTKMAGEPPELPAMTDLGGESG